MVSAPAGIKTAATIEPVELQHAAILNFVLGKYPVPDTFTKMDGARPPERRDRLIEMLPPGSESPEKNRRSGRRDRSAGRRGGP